MLVLGFFWLVILFQGATSHALWMYPTPRWERPDRLKRWPCGTGNQTNDWNATYTTLNPGRVHLTFRETIHHNGAPYRIALTIQTDDSYDRFVLLDHIPHNDQGSTDENSDPPGKYHRISFNLPNISCTRCALQLIQIMSDKFTTPCPNPQGLPESCGNPGYAYFSCANIKIPGYFPPSSLRPFYFSVIGGDIDSRLPYSPNETSILWNANPDKYWTIKLNSASNYDYETFVNVPEQSSSFAGMIYIGSLFGFILVVVFGAALYYGIKPSDISQSIISYAQGIDTQVELESGSERMATSDSD